MGKYITHKYSHWRISNNSIVNYFIKSESKIKICNNVGNNWQSIYQREHELLQKLFKNYKLIQFFDQSENYKGLLNFIDKVLFDDGTSEKKLGFKMNDKTLIMLCGDPMMIGAPIKKGGWEYVYPDYGLVNLFKNKSYEITTRFKKEILFMNHIGNRSERFEEQKAIMRNGRLFKLICGAGNEDAEEVYKLCLVYTLAGANAIDMSANIEVVKAAIQGVNDAETLLKDYRLESYTRPYLTVSIGMPGDHHVGKAKILDDNCTECDACIPVCPRCYSRYSQNN